MDENQATTVEAMARRARRLNQKVYIFHHGDHWAPVELSSDDQAIEFAKRNRADSVEEWDGRAVWDSMTGAQTNENSRALFEILKGGTARKTESSDT